MKKQPRGSGSHALEEAWALFRVGNYPAAHATAEQAGRRGAPPVQVEYLKGYSLLLLDRDAEALQIAQAGLAKWPGDVALQGLTGMLLVRQDNPDEARPLLERALEVRPDDTNLLLSMARVHSMMNERPAAQALYQRLVEADPTNYIAFSNLGNERRANGDPAGGLQAYRMARHGNPSLVTNRSNVLLGMLSAEDTTAQTLRAEAEDFAAMLARDTVAASGPLGSTSPRIRIGFLSADLSWHAVAYFLIPLIANIDRNLFDVFLFRMNRKQDKLTEKLEQYATAMIDVSRLSTLDTVQRIRREQIDVMVDLGGYTGHSPLLVLSHRVAPVQMTWLGFPGTTGMPSIDYRISDWVGDPEGAESHYSEKLLRAPVFCAFHPLVTAPLQVYEDKYRVKDTPALRNGFITFGSCNGLTKLSDLTLKLWADVLDACPNSRLLIESQNVALSGVREMFEARLTAHGIDLDRVELLNRVADNQYVMYNRIDIALDATPYTGGTTTCDALWMGVPVVSLTGEAFHQRISAIFLKDCGLEPLVCEDAAAYVNMASELASDIGRLNELRLSLRQRVESSAMTDAPRFAAWFEQQAYALSHARKGLPEAMPEREQGVYFGGTWYTATDMALSVAAHIETGEFDKLHNVLENLSSTWYRHWMVTYGLAVYKYHMSSRSEAIDLLIEAIGQRPYALPLYRLLAAWLSDNGFEKDALAGLLGEQFGLDLATLEASPVPSAFEVAGMKVEVVADEPANTHVNIRINADSEALA
ncbi:tetratricopeptide repeat protein [Cupriavidus pauculus]|uniref:O-linked N-acetylglucosamine transferase, SPINDLY family protein n=1 Tax=Cupriavidus pauculus TaxID=82633 RepID=UPI001EE2E667|nr:tetratricopeptide repeat protein [Cupriavidus pauculus]GJG94150.1 hypothetical protein CBA19C6_06695 [Cupriavidus pauculus]